MKPVKAIKHVSDTAYWVASYRALESQRQDALFRDPMAKILVGEYGKQISASMTSTQRYSYWTLVIRTCVIDDLIRKYIGEGCTTVINLGAGLDTRPYRLDLPSSLRWIELDFPNIIEMKNKKLKNEKPNCSLERISVDFANPAERQKVLADLNGRIGPAIILTEGVIPYLTEAIVQDLATDLKEYPNFKYWLAEYYAPLLYSHFQADEFKKLLGDSPFQFFPKNWFTFFEDLGWTKKEIRYLNDEGDRLGRSFPLPWFARLIRLVVGREAFAKNFRLQAYVLFERGQ